ILHRASQPTLLPLYLEAFAALSRCNCRFWQAQIQTQSLCRVSGAGCRLLLEVGGTVEVERCRQDRVKTASALAEMPDHAPFRTFSICRSSSSFGLFRLAIDSWSTLFPRLFSAFVISECREVSSGCISLAV